MAATDRSQWYKEKMSTRHDTPHLTTPYTQVFGFCDLSGNRADLQRRDGNDECKTFMLGSSAILFLFNAQLPMKYTLIYLFLRWRNWGSKGKVPQLKSSKS